MRQFKNGCLIVALVIVAGIFGLVRIGANVKDSATSSYGQDAVLSDAHASLRMQTENPETKELHFMPGKRSICGLVKHDGSKIGWVPFAYSHSLGLKVAEVWGRGEPEDLNRTYGCGFLPIAYSDEWKTPFWGGTDQPDIYLR